MFMLCIGARTVNLANVKIRLFKSRGYTRTLVYLGAAPHYYAYHEHVRRGKVKLINLQYKYLGRGRVNDQQLST